MVHAGASRDGTVIGVPGGSSGALCFRPDSADPQVLAEGSDIRNVAVSPDGRLIAAGLHSADEGRATQCARVWDAKSGKLIVDLPTRSICSVAFSPNGRYLTTMSGEVNECCVFEVESWRLLQSFPSKYLGVFSPDESLFAIITNPGEVSLRWGSDLSEFAKLSSPNENTYRPLLFTPDNSRLYACDMELEQIFVWNLSLIRKGLDELSLARNWPQLSLESTPDIAPPSLNVIVDKPKKAVTPQSPATPTGVELVDQVRNLGWSVVLAQLPKLEAADPERFPEIHKFANDIRQLEKEVDSTKSPHEWKSVDIEPLVHRNPHFWGAFYEHVPLGPTISAAHVGLLSACSELEQAHNVTHLLMLDTKVAQQLEESLKPLDRELHRMLNDSGKLVKQGMSYHDANEFDKAIATFNAALEIWPQNAAAHYELGFTKTALKDEAAQQHFATSRRFDPLRREAIPLSLMPMLIPACQSSAKAKSLWSSFLASKRDVTSDDLLAFSECCQAAASIELRFHELALFARQMVIARNRNYSDQDKVFIEASLRQLVPQEDVNRIVERISGEMSRLFEAVSLHSSEGTQ